MVGISLALPFSSLTITSATSSLVQECILHIHTVILLNDFFSDFKYLFKYPLECDQMGSKWAYIADSFLCVFPFEHRVKILNLFIFQKIRFILKIMKVLQMYSSSPFILNTLLLSKCVINAAQSERDISCPNVLSTFQCVWAWRECKVSLTRSHLSTRWVPKLPCIINPSCLPWQIIHTF